MITRLLSFRAAVAAVAVFCILLGPSSVTAQRSGSSKAGAPNRLVSTGRLIRSGQARNGTPRFALMDDSGTLTAYVVPATGVSLARHLNQDVLVTARSVSRGNDGLPYLLAQRVSPARGFATDLTLPIPPALDDENESAADEPRIVTDFTDDAVEFERLTGTRVDSYPFANEYATEINGDFQRDFLSNLEDDFEDGFGDDFNDRLAWGAGVIRDRSVRPAARYGPVRPTRRYRRSVRPVAQRIDEPSTDGPPEILPEAAETFSGEYPPQSASGKYPPQSAGCGNANCSSCAPCGPSTDCCNPCGPAGRFWFRADYLAWWTKASNNPPLVTTSPPGTPAQDAGVLGVEGTEVISGGSDSDSVAQSGYRILLGGWFDPYHRRGWEIDYFGLDKETSSFSNSSFGDPILARPFFNTQLNMQDSELVAFPGVVSGTVSVAQSSEFQSMAIRGRHNLRCDNFFPRPACGGCGECSRCEPQACGPYGGSRVDVTLGWRYMKLDEGLYVAEDLISNTDSTFATFNLYDAFETSNEFSGLEMGLAWDVYRGRWSMEWTSRFAVGNNTRKVAIHGGTTSVVQGTVFSDTGGLLALPSNIGTYEDDQFVVIPEFALTFGYQIAPRVRFLFGYTAIYWNNVVRPGDQIDLNVNPDLLPPAIDTNTLLAPTFALTDATFWAQGFNFGLDWRW